MSLYVGRLIVILLFALFPMYSFGQQVVPGEYLVKFKKQTNLASVAGKISGKATLKAAYPDMNLFHFSVKASQGQTIQDLQNDPEVEYVEPNYILSKSEVTGEVIEKLSEDQMLAQASTYYTQNYAPVNVSQAWGVASPYDVTNRPIVAIIDSGTDANHKVFKNSNALWVNPREIPGNGLDDDYNGYIDDVYGWNFITNSPNFNDDEGHGTHVAGIVVGAGIDIFASTLDPSPIQVMTLKFLDGNGSGSTANAIKAVNYAVNQGAKVINCSWGGSGFSKSLMDALAYAYQYKVLVVTAAGNNGKNNDAVDMYPANYDTPSNISVSATSDSDYLASFSNFGQQKAHVGSPGVYIYSTLPGGYYGSMSGTSMAAPFVAGIAAMAMREARSLTGYQIKNLITGSGTPVSSLNGKVSSGARVNAYNLLLEAKANANTAASQPAYSTSASQDRNVASASASSASSSSKGGCGLVMSSALSQLPKDPGASAGAVAFLLSLPVLLWLALRRKAPQSRRQFERFLMNTDIRVKVGERELVGHMKTISMGGASFSADEALEKGGQVTMKIVGPDGKEVEVEGRIVWSEQNKAYGVQFSQAKDGVLRSIQNWTSRLVKASF